MRPRQRVFGSNHSRKQARPPNSSAAQNSTHSGKHAEMDGNDDHRSKTATTRTPETIVTSLVEPETMRLPSQLKANDATSHRSLSVSVVLIAVCAMASAVNTSSRVTPKPLDAWETCLDMFSPHAVSTGYSAPALACLGWSSHRKLKVRTHSSHSAIIHRSDSAAILEQQEQQLSACFHVCLDALPSAAVSWHAPLSCATKCRQR